MAAAVSTTDPVSTPLNPDTLAHKWADGPFELISETGYRQLPTGSIPKGHYCIHTAVNMAAVHNSFLRAMNAAYLQADGVMQAKAAGDRETVKDFCLFNKYLYECLHEHHSLEEAYFFPELAKITGDEAFCQQEVEQHRIFHSRAADFEKYVIECKDFDSVEFKRLLMDFGEALQEHLHGELAMLLRLSKYDSKAIKRVDKATAKKAGKGLDKHNHLPLMAGCSDKHHEIDGKPYDLLGALPWFVKYLIKFRFSKKHKDVWRFCPCTMLGVKQPLPFAG